MRGEEVGELTAIREPYKPLCFVVVLHRRIIYIDALQSLWSRLLSICVRILREPEKH